MAAIIASATACGGTQPSTAQSIRFTDAAAVTTTAGSYTNFRVTVTDPNADLTMSGTLPAGLSFKADSHGTASLTGTVSPTAQGVYRVSLTAEDSGQKVAQPFTVTVDRSPTFGSGNPAAVSAWTTQTTNAIYLARGYPPPTLSYSGALPPSFSFKPLAGGGALLSGSPGVFDSPCSSQLTIIATNSVGSITMNVTVRLDNLRCACDPSACFSLLRTAYQFGPKIYQDSVAAGQWIYQNGKAVGQVILKKGEPVAVDLGEAAEQDMAEGGE